MGWQQNRQLLARLVRIETVDDLLHRRQPRKPRPTFTLSRFHLEPGRCPCCSPACTSLNEGEVYSIDGTTIFTMGGASSHDMEFRKEGKTWWRSELPNNAEHEHARKTLEEAEWKVDFVITHDAPSNIALELCAICERDFYPTNPLQRFLEELGEHVQFKRWIHGRYHLDRKIDKRHRAIYGDKRRKAHSIPKLWGFLPFIEDPLVFQITTTLFYRLQAIC